MLYEPEANTSCDGSDWNNAVMCSGPFAVTLDFHNTLVHCDAWFQVETATLVSDVMRWGEREFGLLFSTAQFDRADVEYRRLRKAIHRHGHELPAGRSVHVVLSRIGASMPDHAVDDAIETIMRAALVHATPVDGSIETVAALADRGFTIGVVSSAVHHDFLLWALARFGMLGSIQKVTTSASVGFYKSRPEIYWAALRGLGADPESALHVGDSLRFDVGGASVAGMRTAWLRTNGTNLVGLDGIEPDLTLESLIGAAPALTDVLTSSRA